MLKIYASIDAKPSSIYTFFSYYKRGNAEELHLHAFETTYTSFLKEHRIVLLKSPPPSNKTILLKFKIKRHL